MVEAEVEVPGGVDGTLVLDETGLHGTLVNNTGYRLRYPFVLVSRTVNDVRSTEDGWNVAVPLARLERTQADAALLMYPQYGARGRAGLGYSQGQPFDRSFAVQLFAHRSQQGFGRQGSVLTLDERLGPFLCGWIVDAPLGTVDTDISMRENIKKTLLVADINVERKVEGAPPLVPQNVNEFYSEDEWW